MITQEFLLNRFIYKDGKLLYKKRINNNEANTEAGSFDKDGYRKVIIHKKPYRVHKIIYMMHYGYMPSLLDHKDCNPANNKIENLRIANYSQNNSNRKIHKRNISGYKGVSFLKNEKIYRAKLVVNKKIVFIKRFKTAIDAYEAYCIASKKFCKEFSRV